tara:strand:+ start:10322 stop:11662 length:1341 start_codon:yes stop_codon:yes gene_type:complete
MAEDTPEFVTTTADGDFFHDPREDPFAPSEVTTIGNAFPGDSNIDVYPKEEIGKGYHPYELEINEKPNGSVELRCYYGTIYYSIAAIQVQPAPIDASVSDANKAWGIKSQSALPGFGNLTPASFIHPEKGTSQKFCRMKPKGRRKGDGGLPNSCVGDVLLEYYLDSQNHAITEATVYFVHKDEPIPDEEPCGKLDIVGGKLKRKSPTGKYILKIGSFNSSEDSKLQITQCIEDHIYYATTIIDGQPWEDGDDSSYSGALVPPVTDVTDPFGVDDPVEIDPEIDPGVNPEGEGDDDPDDLYNDPPTPEVEPHVLTPADGNAQPKSGVNTRVSEKLGANQPNSDRRTDTARRRTSSPYDLDHGAELVQRGIYPEAIGDFSDENEVHATEHPAGALYSTGAAGSAATSDGTGYSTRADIESISPIHRLQTKSPQGSPGGSPSSTAFSTS